MNAWVDLADGLAEAFHNADMAFLNGVNGEPGDEQDGEELSAPLSSLILLTILRFIFPRSTRNIIHYFPKLPGTMPRQLTAIGRNLNQLTRAVNRGELVAGENLGRVINAGRVLVSAVEDVYHRAVEAAARRAWRPLYREAGLPSPFDDQEKSPAAAGGSAQTPGRGAGPTEGGEAGGG